MTRVYLKDLTVGELMYLLRDTDIRLETVGDHNILYREVKQATPQSFPDCNWRMIESKVKEEQ